MANGNYKETHKKILESAKKMFLTNGFENTNLRDLCKDAGVTTGAFYRHFDDKQMVFSELVKPTVDYINKYYNEAQKEFFNVCDNEKMFDYYNFSDETMVMLVDFIYDRLDAFKLLVECSKGTIYADYIENLTKNEDEIAIQAVEKLKSNGANISISNEEIHMLDRAYFSCLFEVVFHNYPREKALEYITHIGKFFSVGWAETIFVQNKDLH